MPSPNEQFFSGRLSPPPATGANAAFFANQMENDIRSVQRKKREAEEAARLRALAVGSMLRGGKQSIQFPRGQMSLNKPAAPASPVPKPKPSIMHRLLDTTEFTTDQPKTAVGRASQAVRGQAKAIWQVGSDVANLGVGEPNGMPKFSKFLGTVIRGGTTAAETAFLPISIGLQELGNIPGPAKYPFRAVNKAFEVVGTLGQRGGEFLIDKLPMSDESKANLREPVGRAVSFLAQGVLAAGAAKAGQKIIGKATANWPKTTVLNPKLVKEIVGDTAAQVEGSIGRARGNAIPASATKAEVAALNALKSKNFKSWGELDSSMLDVFRDNPAGRAAVQNHLKTRWKMAISEPEAMASMVGQEFVDILSYKLRGVTPPIRQTPARSVAEIISNDAKNFIEVIKEKVLKQEKKAPVTREVAEQITRETIREVPVESEGSIRVGTTEPIEVETRSFGVLSDLVEGQDKINYRVNPALEPGKATFTWDYRNQEAIVEAADARSASALASQFSHPFDASLSQKVSKSFEPLLPDFAGNEAAIQASLARAAVERLNGNGTPAQITTEIRRMANQFSEGIEKLSDPTLNPSERLVSAIRQVIERPKSTEQRANGFTKFINQQEKSSGFLADRIREAAAEVRDTMATDNTARIVASVKAPQPKAMLVPSGRVATARPAAARVPFRTGQALLKVSDAKLTLPELSRKLKAAQQLSGAERIRTVNATRRAIAAAEKAAPKKSAPETKPETKKQTEIREYLKKRAQKFRIDTEPVRTFAKMKLKQAVSITDVHGNKAVIPKGEVLTPYELKDGKVMLKDGETYIVSKNQYQNIQGQSVKAEAKTFAPELKGTEETVKGLDTKNSAELSKLLREASSRGYYDRTTTVERAATQRRINELTRANDTKFSQYQLPGGKDYKEVLIKAPDMGATKPVYKIEPTGKVGEYKVYDPKFPDNAYSGSRTQVEAMKKSLEANGEMSSNNFKSSHWDEPNVLAHLRLNERTYQGKKVTFIEELQSDWAREARKMGTSESPEIAKQFDKYSQELRDKYNTTNPILHATPAEASKWNELYDRSKGITGHPLLKSWQELSIKRALKEAVDNNSSYLAWTTGEQQAARYNLSTQVDNIKWTKVDGGKNVSIKGNDGKMIDMFVDNNGVIQTAAGNSNVPSGWATKPISETIGKGISEKILAEPKGNLSGEGLNIGGEWAKNLYDRQVKSIVEDVTGGKVETIDMGLPVDKNIKQFKISINGNVKEGFAKPNDLKVGATIFENLNEQYVITDVLGDGKFRAVPKQMITSDVIKWAKEEKQTPIEYVKRFPATYTTEAFDISTKKSVQQAIRITPEIKALVQGEAPKFRLSDTFAQFGVKINEAQVKALETLNRKLFGDTDIKVISQLMTPENQKALGSYREGMIKIVAGQADPKATLYHEAVHKYLDAFLTADEQVSLLEAAQVKFKAKTIGETEEILAEKFIEYATKREGVTGVIRTTFEAVLARIKAFLGQGGDAVEAFYRELVSGEASARPTRGMSTEGAPGAASSRPAPTTPPARIPVGTGGKLPGSSETLPASYAERTSETIASVARATGSPVAEVRGVFNKLKRAITSTLEYVQDSEVRVRKLTEKPEMRINDASNPYQKMKLMPGRLGVKVERGYEVAKGITESAQELARATGSDLATVKREVSDYLRYQHAPERNAALGENAAGVTTAEARAKLAELQASPRGAKIKEIADRVLELNGQTLDMLRDSGVISPELHALLRERYQKHVPLNRIFEETEDVGSVLSGRGYDVKGTGIRRAVGSEREVSDILGNVLTNYEQAAIRSEKNIVDTATLNFVRENQATLGDLMSVRKPKMVGEDFGGKPLMERTADPSILQMYEGGKPTWIEIRNPHLATAFRGIGREKLGVLLRSVGAFTRLYSGLATRFNPEFAFPNKLRDLQETAIYLAAQKDIKFKGAAKAVARDAISYKAVLDALRGKDTPGARMYNQMKEAGGTTGGMGLSTRKQIGINLEKLDRLAQSKSRQVLQSLVRYVDGWNTIFEDSTRLSVYRQSIAQGLSRERSAFLAKQASIDFNTMGNGGPVINAIWMFSNASIQGSAKMVRSLKNPKVAVAVGTAIAVAVGTVNSWNDRSDPEWRSKVSKWDRLNGLPVVVPSSDGTFRYFVIPVSWGIKPLKVMADYAYDAASGAAVNLRQLAGDTIIAIADAYNPAGGSDWVSSLTPTIIDVPVELARNQSWSGSKIKPDYDPNLPPDLQYFDSLGETATGRTAISLSELLQRAGVLVSPADMSYAFEQYISGAGRTIKKIGNTAIGALTDAVVPLDEYPMLSRFYRERGADEVQSGDVPALRDTLVEQSRGRNALTREAAALYGSLKSLTDDQFADKIVDYRADNRPLYDKLKALREEDRLNLTYDERLLKQLGVENGERAEFIASKIRKLPAAERRAYYQNLYDKKIVSVAVRKQLREMGIEVDY